MCQAIGATLRLEDELAPLLTRNLHLKFLQVRLTICTVPPFKLNGLALYGFDQQRLIWYVFRLWDMVCS